MPRFGHRARMTAVNAGAAGLVLLVLFFAAIEGFNQLELNSAREELRPALRQAQEESRQNPLAPDLAEIASSYPDLSVAVFDRHGHLVSVRGNIRVPLVDRDGVGELAGVPAVYARHTFPGGTVVAAVGWATREHLIRRLTNLLFALWFPVVALFAVITWRSARSTFLPLQRLSRQAEALSAENLSARLQPETGEYAEFADRLNRFLDRIEQSLRREERFVSDAAHELRTPLTVMRGRLETALLQNRSPEEYRKTLRELGNETERLSGLVEVLLQSATLIQGDVPVLDLEDQAERAHARWVDQFTDRGVQLILESESCSARLLPREFDVLVDNLLSNALKASPRGSICILRLSPGKDLVRIEVIDQGPGIPPQHAEEVFERFTRLDEGRNREEGGFGIGLAVCRRVAEGRGGRVYLAPSASGAHFVVELPSGG